MSAFRFVLYSDTGRVARHRHPFEILRYYLVNTNPRVTPAGLPATVTRVLLLLLLLLLSYYGIVIYAYKYYVILCYRCYILMLCYLIHVGN